jgi:serine/threonine protein kinase
VNADALMAAAGADPLVGQRLGHYQIRRLLGEGGMGIVYLADDTRLGREVALKAVRAQFADDPARRARLEREAQAAAALTHPGIATVYALEEFDGRLFISSEYIAGETLRTELGRGPLSGTRLLETAIGIAQPLAAAHARGLVHRDLKPENVIRTPEGAIKILDFGLARLRTGSHAIRRSRRKARWSARRPTCRRSRFARPTWTSDPTSSRSASSSTSWQLASGPSLETPRCRCCRRS